MVVPDVAAGAIPLVVLDDPVPEVGEGVGEFGLLGALGETETELELEDVEPETLDDGQRGGSTSVARRFQPWRYRLLLANTHRMLNHECGVSGPEP